MTIAWNVDNLKLLHVDHSEVTMIADYLKLIQRKIMIKRGILHEYLRMMLDYWTTGEVIISMISYIKQIVDAFLDEISTTMASSPLHHLFQIHKESKTIKLPEKMAVSFHQWLEVVLTNLTQAGFRVNPKKSTFCSDAVEYLWSLLTFIGLSLF